MTPTPNPSPTKRGRWPRRPEGVLERHHRHHRAGLRHGRGRLGAGSLAADGRRPARLTQVAFYSLFPALLFRSMAKVRLEALELDIIVVFFGTGLLLYLC